MLVRIILLAVIIALAMSMIRKWKAQQDGQSADNATTPAMKKCAHCGVHLPQQDAIRSGDLYFCSETHRQAYAKQHQSH